ncbi:hypothetical protein CP532_5374 [Ophiocordyceps camponoti-leonardi (nom. inval.)]|nr:hypothetical protein CP532_5374 [Ophiocordyceps camponoti-leonardi (nom. inval.)]
MSLEKVPDEIIQHLLYYVSPADNLESLQYLSRRFNRLANEPLLWRYHCSSSFRFWHQHHEYRRKLRRKVFEVDWKQLYLQRTRQNRMVMENLDSIITTRVGRMKKLEQVARLGYDAKDVLLTQCRTDESADDYLARRQFNSRYYSHTLLGSIHRSIAIEEWHQLRQDRDSLDVHVAGVRLERALGAFDMFVLYDQPGDLDDISQMLEDRAAEFRACHPNLDEWSTRSKALALNRWLRANGLTGMCDPANNYRNLRNLLIGQALRHEDHESGPIITSAIFCCLAARVGLTAQCCAFPGHVHAIVFAPPGRTLDGAGDAGETRECLYLNPYGSDDEVPTACFQALLTRFGYHNGNDDFFAPVPTALVALRTARNIRSTFTHLLHTQHESDTGRLSKLICGNSAVNMEAALYSSGWAPLMLEPPNTFEWDDSLANFLRRYVGSWPEDIWLIDKYLWPLYVRSTPLRESLARHRSRGLDDPWEHLRQIRDHDETVPLVHARTALRGSDCVPYKIGQVFRHRRYDWIGVITGWTDKAARSLPRDSQADERPIDRQFYFMCFPSTGSEPHVIGAETIDIITDASQVGDDMFPLAGKFFKRFDRESCTFVSNIREQYPDD